MDHLPIREFLRQFFKISFAELPKLEKDSKPEPPEVPLESDIYNEMNGLPRYDKDVPNNAMKTLPPFPRAPEDFRLQDAKRKIKRAYIIQIALKILELRHYGISEDLKLQALESNRLNIKMFKKNHKGLMKILEFFGDPKNLVEEFMYDVNKERKEQETRQKKERQKEKEDLKARRKLIVKSRFSSTSSSKSSLNERTHSQISSSELSYENGKIEMAPSERRKNMIESKSDFSLMNKIEKAKLKQTPNRNIISKQNKTRQKGSLPRQKGSLPRKMGPKKTDPIKVFDIYDKQLQQSSDSSERVLISSSSSDRESIFPPIHNTKSQK